MPDTSRIPLRFMRSTVCSLEAFTVQIVLAGETAPAISWPHVLVARATPIGLVRLAQQTASATAFRTFAFEMHGGALLAHFSAG